MLSTTRSEEFCLREEGGGSKGILGCERASEADQENVSETDRTDSVHESAMSHGGADGTTIGAFLSETIGDGYRKVEEDLGNGYVRLCTAEADRRQAIQDIRSVEDVLIELLRNSFDAGAKSIYIATQNNQGRRTLAVIDDGSGIVESMRELVFEPRVTSKLESSHVDRWGLHGRGMALFSIRESSDSAEVAFSEPGVGSSIRVVTDSDRVSEKQDQSTFPRFEVVDGVHFMRGPKNLLRTAAEFSMENLDDVSVYIGTFTEIAATLWAHGVSDVPPSVRMFHPDDMRFGPKQLVACAADPEDLATRASALGIPISNRSARRIMDGEIGPLPSLRERLEAEAMPSRPTSAMGEGDSKAEKPARRPAGTKRSISDTDIEMVAKAVKDALSEIEDRYYLKDSPVTVEQRGGRLTIRYDIVDIDE